MNNHREQCPLAPGRLPQLGCSWAVHARRRARLASAFGHAIEAEPRTAGVRPHSRAPAPRARRNPMRVGLSQQSQCDRHAAERNLHTRRSQETDVWQGYPLAWKCHERDPRFPRLDSSDYWWRKLQGRRRESGNRLRIKPGNPCWRSADVRQRSASPHYAAFTIRGTNWKNNAINIRMMTVAIKSGPVNRAVISLPSYRRCI